MFCCVGVEEGTRGVKTRFGQYVDMLEPGFNLYFCCIENVDLISVRVRQLDVRCDSKTLDNVTTHVRTSILYQVDENMVCEAYYKLNDHERQMRAFVYDEVRSELPTMTLDEAYENKDTMAEAVTKTLSDSVNKYGILVKKVLITDLQPDSKVQNAMNEINSSKRQRAAAQEKAEGDKILIVKNAEADMESQHLSGQGIARMRTAITNGCKESINDMKDGVGLKPNDVVHMMLVTQYLDTLKDFADSGRGAVMVENKSH